jgi:hypothetical protein
VGPSLNKKDGPKLARSALFMDFLRCLRPHHRHHSARFRPPVDRDALTHHLFVPKLWLHHGGFYNIPEIPLSYA